MSLKPQITQELSDSISNVLGRNVKILHKSLIRMESRGDKVDNKVLVVTAYRIFITTNKIPTRIDNGFHLMEVEMIESKKANNLSITLIHEHKPVSILAGEEGSSDGIITIMNAVTSAYDDLFPNVPLEDIISKIKLPFSLPTVSGLRKHSPCGDFSNQYAAMCDLCQTPFRAEVAWDVDTIYLAHDIRMLHLKDFDHLEQRDLIPLIIALQHNCWFVGVNGDGVRAHTEAWEALARVLRCAAPNHTSISWRNASLRSEHASRLGHALARAKRPPAMHTMDFSQNNIEDKGAISFLSGLSKSQEGFRHISFSQCGITGKTVSHLASMLNDNPNHVNTLTHLDLSHNNLKDDVHNLYNFLAQPNALTYLNLTNTETTLENMWGALLRGCAARISTLLLSRNPWTNSRKVKEPPPSFRQFFTSCLMLNLLDFSYCKMPADVIKSLLLGLACNESAANVQLNLSGVLSSNQAAHVLESCIHGVRCLQSLDLSDNSMEFELAGIVRAIGKNHSITKLTLSKLTGKRSFAPPFIQALVHVLQDPDTSITTLDLSDCKLKSDLFGLLNALGAARRVRVLDVSGNAAGDAGGRLLAKALQCNCTLHTLYLDRNGFSLQGLTDIALGVRRSVSISHVEFPSSDASAGGKVSTERVAALWREMHNRASSNNGLWRGCVNVALRRGVGVSGACGVGGVASALPTDPLPAAQQKAAALFHHHMHAYLQRCSEVFSAMGASISNVDLITLQAVKDAMTSCNEPLQELLNDAVERLAHAACDTIENPEESIIANSEGDMPDLLSPISHSGATPLGFRRRERVFHRIRPKSVAETKGSAEMMSLPTTLAEDNDALAELPAHTLRHIVKGRPRRTKTRAPSRPITDQSQEIDEGIEEFYRLCRTPPGSEDPSQSTQTRSMTSLNEHVRHSPTLTRDDTMYSVTSGESTPVLLEEVSRCRSIDNMGSKTNSATPPPSRSSDDVNNIEGVETCVGGSIVGITPGAALTSNHHSDAIYSASM